MDRKYSYVNNFGVVKHIFSIIVLSIFKRETGDSNVNNSIFSLMKFHCKHFSHFNVISIQGCRTCAFKQYLQCGNCGEIMLTLAAYPHLAVNSPFPNVI